MEYEISLKRNGDDRSPLHFQGRAENAATFIGHVMTGRFKLPVVVGKTKKGKDKTRLEPFKPNGKWEIYHLSRQGVRFDEMEGRVI